MAFTLNDSNIANLTDDQIRAALDQLVRPASALAEVLHGILADRESIADDIRAEQAAERFFEERGYDDARNDEARQYYGPWFNVY